MSSFFRRVVRTELARLSFLPDFDKKALNIGNEAGNAGPDQEGERTK